MWKSHLLLVVDLDLLVPDQTMDAWVNLQLDCWFLLMESHVLSTHRLVAFEDCEMDIPDLMAALEIPPEMVQRPTVVLVSLLLGFQP